MKTKLQDWSYIADQINIFLVKKFDFYYSIFGIWLNNWWWRCNKSLKYDMTFGLRLTLHFLSLNNKAKKIYVHF